MNTKKNNPQVEEIDLLELARVLWHRAWVIVVAGILAAALAFSYAFFLVTPQYESSAMMYVNNSSISLGGTSVTFSSGEISAAKSLVDTYSVIVKTRSVLEEVIKESGVNYTYEQLEDMVTAADVDSTEIFSITVTSTDPSEAALIANTIATVLPDKIADIMDGASVRIVDKAVVNSQRVSPSYSKYTAMGFVLGVVISCAIILAIYFMDDIIRDEDYLTQTYADIPLLAAIPDLMHHSGESSYGYGYGASHNKKGGQSA